MHMRTPAPLRIATEWHTMIGLNVHERPVTPLRTEERVNKTTCDPPLIDWVPPQPRPGMAGWLDRFVGPGATAGELSCQIGAAFAAAVAVPAYAFVAGLNWSSWQLAVSGLLAMDLVGGVVTNATAAAQRWYHRRGQGARQHLAFAAAHIIQLLLVGWFFRGGDWVFVGVFYAHLMLAVTVVCLSPLYLQRPIAMMFVVGAVLLDQFVFPSVPAMAWFVPVFFVKLLISHLLKEAPYSDRQQPRCAVVADQTLNPSGKDGRDC